VEVFGTELFEHLRQESILGKVILNGFRYSSGAADQLLWFQLPAD